MHGHTCLNVRLTFVSKLVTTQSGYQRINDIWKLYKIFNEALNIFIWVYEWIWVYYTVNTDMFILFKPTHALFLKHIHI